MAIIKTTNNDYSIELLENPNFFFNDKSYKFIIRNNLDIIQKELFFTHKDLYIIQDNIEALLIGDLDTIHIYFNSNDTIMIDSLMTIEIYSNIDNNNILDFDNTKVSIYDYIDEEMKLILTFDLKLEKFQIINDWMRYLLRN